MEPLYTPTSCKAAYELRWSLALFATQELPPPSGWIAPLQEAVEADGVRILEHHQRSERVWQFLLSTKPHATPPAIVKSVKGRLQHLVQSTHPKAFRRNFSLASVGGSRRDVVESYVASQLDHHQMAEEEIQQRLAK